MAHRGPDGAGLWRGDGVVLAHRRLAVVDPSPAGHQPMAAPEGRAVLVYNGELYNDAELRAELAGLGWPFRSRCDTETVLAALCTWGEAALPRLRGMFALGFLDVAAQRLILARDRLGIKPLYYWVGSSAGQPEMCFASEIPPLLAHPAVSALPDLPGISAYLTTIRLTLGSRTLFEGVRSVRPGECVRVALGGEALRVEPVAFGTTDRSIRPMGPDLARLTRSAVEESVRRHLRADVPTCCLLSGGLDSTIVALVASRHVDGRLATYCSGVPGAGSDLEHAARVALEAGYDHREAPVDRALFAQRWPEMVARTGLPLSTPNEVAINAVARCLRAGGHTVTISGEGADELFGGYDLILSAAARFEAGGPDRPGRFHLDAAGWVRPGDKPALLREHVRRRLEEDHALEAFYEDEFDAARAERDDDSPIQAHLRFIRRINLTGLLLRLDSATMLESVEGRVPLADGVIADLAESLPLPAKVALDGTQVRSTKVALREAFAGDLPPAVLARPKASFPLPFQDWLGAHADLLRRSALIAELFEPAAVEAVAARPGAAWTRAWPMINLAMWGRRWWG